MEIEHTFGPDPINEDSYALLIKKLLEYLSHVPAPIRNKVEAELKELLKLLKDTRPPRFLLVGRRGAGKSTLINALFDAKVAEVGSVNAQTGAARWFEYERDGKKIEVLDTRGFQEGQTPLEADDEETPEQSIYKAIEEECPDVILFLCKAKEVDSAIQSDLVILEKIAREIDRFHSRQSPIVGVLTQCDELDPPDIRTLPTDDEEKNNNIQKAVETLESHLSSKQFLKSRFARVIPTAGYARYRQDGTLDFSRDSRWNIDQLAELLVEELPKEAQISWARVARIRKYQRETAGKFVYVSAAGCAAVAAQPIPGADIPIITCIQAIMVTAIGYVSGRDLSLATARDFLGTIGVGVGVKFGLEAVAQSLVKLIPGYGSVISAITTATATKGIGDATISFFIDQTPIEIVKQRLKRPK